MPAPSKQTSLTWLLKFIALLALFYALGRTRMAEAHVLHPLAQSLAWLAAQILTRLGLDVAQRGASLHAGDLVFDVTADCTGMAVFLVYAAAVLAYPADRESRIRGLLAGFGVIMGLNLARTAGIALITSRFPGAFHVLHVIIGQIVVLTAAVATFLLWQSGKDALSFTPAGGKEILKTSGLFCLGCAAGYAAYYFIFLHSAAGDATRNMVGRHLARLLNLILPAGYENHIITTPGASVYLGPACMSAPVSVLFTGVVAALPIRPWKRVLTAVLAFFPVHYLYHLAGTGLIVLMFDQGAASKQENVFYLYFGPMVLTLAGFLLAGYFGFRKRDLKSYAKWLGAFLLVSALTAPAACLVGEAARRGLLAKLIAGGAALNFHTKAALDAMFVFQMYVWTTLLILDPAAGRGTKLKAAVLGGGAFLALCLAAALLVSAFGLHPDAFLLQFVAILLPFSAWFFIFHD